MNPTPRLDDAIQKLGKTPNIITQLGHHFTARRLHLKKYNGVTLQEAAMKGLLLAERDLARKGHKSIINNVNSSYRSWAKQAALYAAYKAGLSKFPAAPPGRSYHGIGLALDIGVWYDQEVRKALAKHGWNWFGSGDSVHFSYHVHG